VGAGRGNERVYAIADEDLERTTEDKTSSVHFLRFDLTPAIVAAVKQGAAIAVGIEHEVYTHTVDAVPENVRRSLINDLADRTEARAAGQGCPGCGFA